MNHALLKGIRSLEIKQYTLERKYCQRNVPPVELKADALSFLMTKDFSTLQSLSAEITDMEKLAEITGMDPFFVAEN